MQQRGSSWSVLLRGRIWWVLAALLTLSVLGPAASGASSNDGVPPQPLSATELNLDHPQGDYVIGPQDKLRVRVLELKDFGAEEEEVDANGQIDLPLVGTVTASGKTTSELQQEIAKLLGDRYLQSPHVSVSVTDSASQKVTVEGEVKNPGVFLMKGRTTLMMAISMAGGPTTNADLRKVAVIRVVNGQRRAAICNYKEITKGRAPDPLLQGNDTLVMDSSFTRTAWSTLMQNLPIFSLLAYMR
jgi:polysaccharide biosynthesis/export protein